MMTATLESGIDSMFVGDPNWQERANCKGKNIDSFFPTEDVLTGEEPPYPTPEARQICGRCDVKPECLAYALASQIDYGTFAGMSAYQRRLINKKKSRKRCPGCGAGDNNEIEVHERNEICLACGISWDRGVTDVDD